MFLQKQFSIYLVGEHPQRSLLPSFPVGNYCADYFRALVTLLFNVSLSFVKRFLVRNQIAIAPMAPVYFSAFCLTHYFAYLILSLNSDFSVVSLISLEASL